MLKHKYTLSKNHGLLPKINIKTEESIITTYALLNTTYHQHYQLHVHPHSDKTVVMFNQTEYIQRQCSTVIVDNDPAKVPFCCCRLSDR